MSEPLVSIVMPVFNAERFLTEAIESVLRQHHKNWELIIVDDGSTDASLEIARRFSDPRIHVLTQANKGVSSARNAALKVMRGEYFCFLDADDVLPPMSVHERLKCFTSETICFVDGTVEIRNTDLTQELGSWRPAGTEHVASLVRLDGKCFFGPTWMIKNVPGTSYSFDEELTHGEELFFYMSYAHLGSYAVSPAVVLHYRRRRDSSMSNLFGLARGYSRIATRLDGLAIRPSNGDRIIFALRSRKMMCLSFLRAGKVGAAVKYLFTGRV